MHFHNIELGRMILIFGMILVVGIFAYLLLRVFESAEDKKDD